MKIKGLAELIEEAQEEKANAICRALGICRECGGTIEEMVPHICPFSKSGSTLRCGST